jgi:hypothetical protein
LNYTRPAQLRRKLTTQYRADFVVQYGHLQINCVSGGKKDVATMKLSKIASSITLLATVATMTGCGLTTNKDGAISINSSAAGGIPQGSGYRTQRERGDVTNFHAIDDQAVATLVITDGQPFKVIVEADENVIPQVETAVKDGVLLISLDKSITTSTPIRLLISMPKLDKFRSAGVGEVTITGLKEPFLSILESGAGSLTASGSADMVDLTMSGVGNANLKDLQGKAVTALLSGTGSAKVTATESLTATVSGIGKLTYSGNPPKVQKSVTGLGTISAQ